MPKKITKKDVAGLVNSANFLEEQDKKEWLEEIEDLDDGQLVEANDFFVKIAEGEKDLKLKLLFKSGKGPEYMQKLKDINKNFMKEIIAKEEKFLREGKENPEDVLKQLDNL